MPITSLIKVIATPKCGEFSEYWHVQVKGLGRYAFNDILGWDGTATIFNHPETPDCFKLMRRMGPRDHDIEITRIESPALRERVGTLIGYAGHQFEALPIVNLCKKMMRK